MFYLLYGGVVVVFLAVGWLISERQPSNAIGALILTFGVLFAAFLPADLYLQGTGVKPGGDVIALFVVALDAPMFILIALTLIVFPDGRPLSPRWRWAIAAGAVGIVLAPLGYALDAAPFDLYPDHRSPVGIVGVPGAALVYTAYVIMLTLLVLAAGALIIRWRRGDVVVRAQIKWVVAASLAMLATEILNVATFRPDDPNALTNVLASAGIVAGPHLDGLRHPSVPTLRDRPDHQSIGRLRRRHGDPRGHLR